MAWSQRFLNVFRRGRVDADILVWLETTGQDLRYALRSFRHTPFVTAIIIASLALAIGASTAMFSIVHAALVRALPYADPDRIVMLWTANLLNNTAQNTSVPNLEDWKAQARTFEDMAAFREADGPLVDPMQSAIDTEWVGYALWLRRFGGAADVIGQRVNVAGFDVEIVGVMSRSC